MVMVMVRVTLTQLITMIIQHYRCIRTQYEYVHNALQIHALSKVLSNINWHFVILLCLCSITEPETDVCLSVSKGIRESEHNYGIFIYSGQHALLKIQAVHGQVISKLRVNARQLINSAADYYHKYILHRRNDFKG